MACSFLWKLISGIFQKIFLNVEKLIAPFSSQFPPLSLQLKLHTFIFLSIDFENIAEFYFEIKIFSIGPSLVVMHSWGKDE